MADRPAWKARRLRPGRIGALLGGMLLATAGVPYAIGEGSGAMVRLQGEISQVYRNAAPALVRVKAASEETDEGGKARPVQRLGTGFFIGDNLVATNAVVVGGASRIWVEVDGVPILSELIGSHAETRLALLRPTRAVRPNAGLFGDAAPADTSSIGSLVVAITMPLDLPPSPSLGMVTGIERSFAGRPFPVSFLRINLPANPGEVGSPVLDADGRLVGMMIAAVPDLHASYVLPAAALRRLQQDFEAHGELQPAWPGALFSDQADSPTPGRSVVVAEVVADSPASASGLERGDLVISAAGKPISSIGDLREVLFYARPGDSLHLRIKRLGKDLDLTLRLGRIPTPPSRGADDAVPPQPRGSLR